MNWTASSLLAVFLYLLFLGGEDAVRLTEKQNRFIDYYIETGNASEAARRAGYSLKTAFRIGQENLQKPAIRAAIQEKLNKMADKRVAKAEEVLEFMTAVMRGDMREEAVVVEGAGDGFSSARIIEKQVSAKERVRAAEGLAKRYGLLTEKVQVNVKPVVIGGEDDLED